MDEDQQFCLRWNNHQSTLISVFDTLLEKGTLVDCTLAAEGQFLKAHKVVLSACSPYFAALLTQQYDKHPIFILKDVKFQELRAMMDYMYRGEVNISQDQLAALLKAAESLQIKGLSDSSGGRNNGTQAKDTSAANKAKGTGLTIEQKMPRSAAEMDADLSEGSASPNARKRKKVRRRSIETNNVDNHDHHSNSSSHSMPHGGAAATQQQSQPQQQTASTMPTNITSATSSANVLSVTKKTDQEMKSDGEMDESEDQQNRAAKDVQRQNNGGRKSISSSGAAPLGKTTTGKDGRDLIEPKNEYDESNEETVEDLTLDEEMLEELDQAGPSHGGESSSQGYPQWPADRSQDNDSFMPGQDGHHRDAQGEEELMCTPMIYMNNGGGGGGGANDSDRDMLDNGQRFFCTVCDKSYLRKRHLQRHMRDECIGIPPRFQCSMCTSKFRRKYHLVRHLNSKHAVIVTKENELELVRSKSSELRGVNGKRMRLESMDDSEYMTKQDKLFTENNFFNNEIFTHAMNMIMPKMDPDSKMMPVIDTNQLLESIKQQQSILGAAGMGDLAGLPPMMPTMQQLSEDPEMYARLMNLKKMAVNAMNGMSGSQYYDTDCESDDAQDLRVPGGGGGNARSTADSDETDEREKDDRLTPSVDDVHMKMNIELRPDFMASRLCESNQKSQIIPNDTLN